tara:strand:+ start:490 stop:1185 length:696 start_codon:yes stop_codon:yes gene_type:complete
MCGRKTLTKDIASIIEEMNIEEWEAHDYKPSYNVAPTDFSPIIIQENKKIVKMMKWGLIPTWSNNSRNGSKMINARLETILKKPSFSNLVHKNRCIVLSDGYYEWSKQDNQAYYITHKNNKILPLAGLWTKWENSDSNTILNYTVVTTTSIKNIAHIHNRMPVILEKKNLDKWIDCNNYSIVNCLNNILLEKPHLKFYPVSNIVNSIKNNSIECTKPQVPQKTMNLFYDEK